jgi:outer membrane protein OmpA-like peptidoglycan-associated protein
MSPFHDSNQDSSQNVTPPHGGLPRKTRAAGRLPPRLDASWLSPCLLGLLVLLASALSSPARAAEPRSQTLDTFESIRSSYSDSGLKAWVNEGRGAPIRIGDHVVYHFESPLDGYLTVIHLDSHGVATLLYPTADTQAGHVGPGESRSFPPADAGFELNAEPPLGREVVMVVATKEPIARDRLAAASDASQVVVFEAERAPALAEALRRELAARDPGAVQVAMIEQTIEGRSGASQYRSADIVDYFTTRTRSIRRPRLDFQIHFQTASADLDATARANLDVAAEALSNERLAGMKFVLGGHTDDVGDASYNMNLSEERAESARRYLIEKGIDPSRLDVQAFGETKPLEEGTDPHARSMNRRVDFTLIR